MEFQERPIHRPDLVFLDHMMLIVDEIEEQNDLMEQANWEDMGLVFFEDFSESEKFRFFDDIRVMCESKSEKCALSINPFETFATAIIFRTLVIFLQITFVRENILWNF